MVSTPSDAGIGATLTSCSVSQKRRAGPADHTKPYLIAAVLFFGKPIKLKIAGDVFSLIDWIVMISYDNIPSIFKI